jgi:general secretion pathway protein K
VREPDHDDGGKSRPIGQAMKNRRRSSRNGGFVLVIVISMVMAMIGLVLAFNRRARAGVQVADGLAKSAQALCCARAGLAAAASVVGSGGMDQGQTPQVQPPRSHWALSLGGGACQVDLSDEQGKINLNRLIDSEGRVDRSRVDQLFRLIDLINAERRGEPIGYGIVPALVDWIDADDERTCFDFMTLQNTGAESDYYQGLAQPIVCENAPLAVLEDQLSVKGVTDEVYQKLAPYVTVYGDGQINLNAAGLLTIESLSEQMEPTLAQAIIDRRQVKCFQSLDELAQMPGMTTPVFQRVCKLATVQSGGAYYQIQSIGQVDRTRRTVSAILRRNTGTGTVDIVSYKEIGDRR